MKRVLINLIVGAVLLLPLVSYAASGPSTASVQGTVVDADHRLPLAGVLVSLIIENSRNRKSTLTDKSGNFVFKALESGQYMIRFQKDGYEDLYLTDLSISQGEAVKIGLPLALHKPAFSLIDYPMHPSPCGSLVQPGQTADVYVVCADSR